MTEELTIRMLFDMKERDDIAEYCIEKDVPAYELIRNAVLQQLHK